jgi:hypothetical protein
MCVISFFFVLYIVIQDTLHDINSNRFSISFCFNGQISIMFHFFGIIKRSFFLLKSVKISLIISSYLTRVNSTNRCFSLLFNSHWSFNTRERRRAFVYIYMHIYKCSFIRGRKREHFRFYSIIEYILNST